MKASVLEGDLSCPNLIAPDVYDTMPVHYLSMVTDKIEWTEINKDLYNVDSEEVEVSNFLRLNHINKYNQEIGNVDLVDQLRGSYRPDHCIRNMN